MGKNYNKAKKSDTYTFTTNVNDDYSDRVVAEAQPTTNFLLLRDHDRRDGSEAIIVLARKSALESIPDQFDDLYLGGATIGEWKEHLTECTLYDPFTGLVTSDVEDVPRELENLRHEIRRIKNIVEEKYIKVAVESF
jgi:hypothetical protein